MPTGLVPPSLQWSHEKLQRLPLNGSLNGFKHATYRRLDGSPLKDSLVLSFVSAVLGVTFVLCPAFWQFGRDLVAKESIATVDWVILAIGVALGLINAFLYSSRAKAKLSS